MTDQLNHSQNGHRPDPFMFDNVDTDPAFADIDSEQSLIGCVLTPAGAGANAAAFHEAAEIIMSTDFYRPAHSIIWERLAAMADRGLPMTVQTLSAELRTAGDLDRIQGTLYLLHLQERGLSTANATYFAKQIAAVSLRRRMHQATLTMGQIARTGTGDMMALVEQADEEWGAVHQVGAVGTVDGVEELGDMLPSAYDDLASDEDAMGVPSGFADMDALLTGFHAGELIVVAARPGAGKTVLGLNLATTAAKAGHRAMFVSLEMNRKELLHRILSAEADIPLHCLRSKNMGEELWERMRAKHQELTELPLVLSHNPAITFAQLKAEIRRQVRRKGLGLVVLDYLQLLQDPESKSADTREREVALMTRGLKVLAQQMEIPIVVLCQLNRDSAKREDTRPKVHELRESGAVEQDANVVILIHREDLHDKDSPRSGEADLIIGKNRNGPTSDVTVAFQGHYARFREMGPG
ncbi:replicative DNA helicase [Nocardiopsis dassonvillei]|uniref:replicative DNA helicase n=1 Tax=Nocardiopsis dassonvillei TaxID=2014 RepID=UPI0033CAA5D7